MIHAIGTDIVEIDRISSLWDRFKERFARRILGPVELEIIGRREDPTVFLAGRFAAKEAVIKALGGILSSRPPYAAIQIDSRSDGRPQVVLAPEIRDRIGSLDILVSISHERQYAVAMVVIVSNGTSS